MFCQVSPGKASLGQVMTRNVMLGLLNSI